jgi:hypothetical protein
MNPRPAIWRRYDVTAGDEPIQIAEDAAPEAAGDRGRRDAGMVGAADWASRGWGLIVLAVGLWFFADVTLGLDMPSLAWREMWPLVLIVVGLAIVLRGLARRR